MNNKGFTLTELLAVIIIVGLLLIITISGINGISKRIRTDMLCTKVKTIEQTAILYGEDNLYQLHHLESGSNQDYTQVDCSLNQSSCIDIESLIENSYIKEEDTTNGQIINPLDNSSMNSGLIKVYVKNNRVYAKMPEFITTCNSKG